jgi:LPS-assembly protein
MTGLRLVTVLAMAVLVIGTLSGRPAVAQEDLRETPILFKADSLRYDEKLGVVVASGNVEAAQGERILMADRISYNERADLLTASGNVSLLEPSGDVVFADFMELTGDFKNGIARNLRARLTSDALIAATGGSLTDGTKTVFRKAVYTACKLCKDNPERAPVWQIKAYRVTHDKAAQQIEYRDAVLELWGVPVFYTPYFAQPDPTVKRKSGFLVPSYGSDSELGAIVRVPYYFNIAPDRDATLTPIVTSKEGLVLAGEYRQRFTAGEIQGRGSITRGSFEGRSLSRRQRLRGHFYGLYRQNINDDWRGGLDIAVASDDTYLRRYIFSSDRTLTNRAFVEGFRGSNYATANAYFFQGLRAEDDIDTTPIILPKLEYAYFGEPGWLNSRWSFDGDLLMLSRIDGTDSRRLSLKPSWQLPYTTDIGEVYTVSASLQADAYWVDDVVDQNNPARSFSGFTGRMFPQIGVDWRFPLVGRIAGTTPLVEPIAGVIFAPNGANPEKIPNEDSLDFELDDTNVFSPSRFTGLDRVEGGTRAYYGMRVALYDLWQGGFVSGMVGQSLRLRSDSTFEKGSGLEDDFSDIVGRIEVKSGRFLDLLYRFRFDASSLRSRRNELSARIGTPALEFTSSYIFIKDPDQAGEITDREELFAALQSQITENWGVSFSTRRDLTPGGGTLEYTAGFRYSSNECLIFTAEFRRRFTEDRDLRPSDSIFFRVILRTLGEVKTGTST